MAAGGEERDSICGEKGFFGCVHGLTSRSPEEWWLLWGGESGCGVRFVNRDFGCIKISVRSVSSNSRRESRSIISMSSSIGASQSYSPGSLCVVLRLLSMTGGALLHTKHAPVEILVHADLNKISNILSLLIIRNPHRGWPQKAYEWSAIQMRLQ